MTLTMNVRLNGAVRLYHPDTGEVLGIIRLIDVKATEARLTFDVMRGVRITRDTTEPEDTKEVICGI